jgi:hypothetical protein
MNTTAQKEVKRCDVEIATLTPEVITREWRRESHEVTLAALEAETAGRPRTVDEERRIRDAREAIAEIDGGPVVILGHGHVVRQPGLVALKARLERLKAERDEWYAKSLLNPDELVRCRLTRMVNHHMADGRPVKVGEEVMLTRRQLEALGDRFELVG